MISAHRGGNCVAPATAILVSVLAIATAPSQAAVSISAKATRNITCANGVCTPSAKDATLNATDLAHLLAGSDVKIVTGTSARDIDVDTAFSWTSANRLTLDAQRAITFRQPVTVAGKGSLTLVTNDGGTGGALSFVKKGRVTFFALSSSLIVNGQSFTLENSVAALAAAIQASPNGNFALANRYDASHDGTYASAPIATQFSGTFEGLGNTIANLSIDDARSTDNVGLFAQIDVGGVLRDTAIANAKVQGVEGNVGTLAGLNNGTISGAFASGSATASKFAFVGGLAGLNQGAIVHAHAAVAVTGGNSSYIGGLVGDAFGGTIMLSSASGSVAGGSGVVAGGLAGANSGSIEQCFATGSGAGQSEGEKIGGLVGLDTGSIGDSYATGNPTVQVLSYTGGLIGFYQPDNGVSVSNAYSTGTPSGGSGADVGGFVGFDASSGTQLSNDYWDTTTSGITNLSQGAGQPPNDPNITGETSAQLEAGLPQGFSAKIWAENPTINNGLPYLIVNPPQ